MKLIGVLLIVAGVCFIAVGIIGVYRFHNFYARILSAADVDTVGLITILAGVIFIEGISWFSLKVLLILVFLLVLNPIVTSSIVSSAFHSGYKLKSEEDSDDNG